MTVPSLNSGDRLLSVVIPARNEAASIGRVIAAIPRAAVAALGYGIEVVVVDNASTDDTAAASHALGARVVHEEILGYGRALKRGLREARGSVVVTVDADGSHPVPALPAMLEDFAAHQRPFMTASRFQGLSLRQRMALRQLGNSGLSVATRLLFGVPTTDSQCGMWMMTQTLALQAQALSDDWRFSVEIKILAWRVARVGWREWPIRAAAREAGASQLHPLRDGLRIGWHLLRLRLRGGPPVAPLPAG